VLVFVADFNNCFQTICGKCRREHKYLFHSLYAHIPQQLCQKMVEAIFDPSGLKTDSVFFLGYSKLCGQYLVVA
jgi:hypothetical protein